MYVFCLAKGRAWWLYVLRREAFNAWTGDHLEECLPCWWSLSPFWERVRMHLRGFGCCTVILDISLLWYWKLSFPCIVCKTCQLSEHKKANFGNQGERSVKTLYRIHSDVWRPTPLYSLFGARRFVVFVDDHTRLTWVYALVTSSKNCRSSGYPWILWYN